MVDNMKTLQDAFVHTLKDVYYAENALTKALPKMSEAASTKDLKKAFDDHLTETKEQIKILKNVFKSIDETAEGEKCDAIEGLIKETEGLIEEASGKALEASLIGAAQAVEHSRATAITEAVNVSKLCRIQGQPIEKACD